MEHYRDQKSYSQERYFVHLENWLRQKVDPERNIPLLIEAEEGVGKKMLIVKWIEHHKKNKPNHYPDVVITHFASMGGNSCNYFYAIYSILTKLREALNINQKVELLEGKLRKYFNYWLDLCNRKIKENVIYDGNIILVLEGLENFADPETDQESSLKFWLPKTFPDRIRVIVTASPTSKSAEYLRALGSNIVAMSSDKKIIRTWLESTQSKGSDQLLVDQIHVKKVCDIIDNRLILNNIKMIEVKAMMGLLAPTIYPGIKDELREKELFRNALDRLDWETLRVMETEVELLHFVTDFYCDKLAPRTAMLEVLSIICLTLKGLTESEILGTVKVTDVQLTRILSIFKIFFMNYRGYWICNNEIFRKVVEMLHYGDPEIKVTLHRRIAEAMEKSNNCVRKLEEQTFHLYSARDFRDLSNLKQIIATIENFLMLFNPMTKFDLFRYWQILERSGYDPVTEYNKGVELFDSHYNPEPDKLFVIILQVCRFLKEFSDFETEITPVFRHPQIKGKIGVIKKKNKTKEMEETGKKSNQDGGSQAKLGGTSGSNSPRGGSNYKSTGIPDKQAPESPSSPKTRKLKDGSKAAIKVKPGATSKIEANKKKNNLGALSNEVAKERKKADPLGLNDPFYDENNDLSDIEDQVKMQKKTQEQETFNYLDVIGLLTELKNFKLTNDTILDQPPKKEDPYAAEVKKDALRYEEKNIFVRRFEEILADWEDVNVEVPEGKQRFREHFLRIIEEKNSHKNRARQRDEDMRIAPTRDDSDDDPKGKQAAKENDVFKNSGEVEIHQYQVAMEDIDLEIKPEKDPSFYYYKRWIWIIFPWACMSIKKELNFSDMIARCYSSATKYMRIDEEKEFYQAALEIAIEFKAKKKAIYAKKTNEEAEAQDTERLKMKRLEEIYKKYNKELRPNELVSFSNVIKDRYQVEKEQALLKASLSKPRLPAIGGLKISKSQAMIRPNLKGLDHPKDPLFLTNADGSVISVENLKYENINSSTFILSKLERRLEDKRVLNSEVTGVLGDLKMLSMKKKQHTAEEYDREEPSKGLRSNEKNLEYMEEVLEKHIYKDIRQLERENEELNKELNDLNAQNKFKIRLIERIPKNQLGGGQKGPNQEDLLQSEYEMLKSDNITMKQKLADLTEIKERMANIIEICEINSHQNEKWIIGLNKLYMNYEKMIQLEDTRLKEIKKTLVEIEKVREQFVSEFLALKEQKVVYTDHIESHLMTQSAISEQIAKTDYLIRSKLLLEQRNNELAAKTKKALKESQLKVLDGEKRKHELEAEMEKLRDKYYRVEKILNADGLTLQVQEGPHKSTVPTSFTSFESSPQKQTLLDNLEKKKDLEQEIFENKGKLQELDDRIKYLIQQKEILELAIEQKGKSGNERETDDDDEHGTFSLDKLKEACQRLDVNIETAATKSAKMKKYLSSLKAGIFSLGTKCNVEEIENNFTAKSAQVLVTIQDRMKIARSHLTHRQFQALVNGRLDVRGFLKKVQFDDKNKLNSKNFQRFQTEGEDSARNEPQEMTN